MLIAVFVLYAIGTYGLRYLVILPSFSALEEADAGKDVSRVIDAINREAYHVGQQASDWSAWDDTYQFVQDGNEAYIVSNLARESLEESVGIHLLYICDRDGRVVWGEVFDASRGGKLSLREFPADTLGKDHFLLQHSSPVSEYTGILLTEAGPMLISSRPVVPTSGDGPARGSLIMGRFLGETLLRSLKQQTQIDFGIMPFDLAMGGPNMESILSRLLRERFVIEEIGPDLLRAYGMIVDLKGRPALLVTANLPREIMAKGREASKFASLSVLATAIALVVVGSILVMMVVNLLLDGRDKRRSKAWAPREIMVLALVAMAGGTLSLGAFITVRGMEEDRMRTTFQERATERCLLLQNRINHYLAELKALQRLFDASADVSRENFRNFVTPVLDEHPDILAFEWVPRVFAVDRAAHEQSIREEGRPDYRLTERNPDGTLVRAGWREVYYPVAYVEPLAGNEAILGYAPGSTLPGRLAAIERARDTGQLAATPAFPLARGAEQEVGFFVFAPVYRHFSPLRTIEQRHGDLVGFAQGVFRVGSLFETAIADSQAGGIDLSLFDRTDPRQEQLLHFHASRTRSRKTDAPTEPAVKEESVLSHSIAIELCGRQWTVVCTPSPKFLDEHRQWQSSLVLAVSLLFTAWLVSYLVGNRRRAAHTEAVVEERTAELQRSEARFRRIFESIQDIYVEVSLSEGRIVEISPSIEILSGYKREEMIGKLTTELYARPEEREALLRELMTKGYVSDYELTLVDKGGETKVCSYMAKIILNQAGQPSRIVGTIRDISERKQTEASVFRMMEESQRAREQAEQSEFALRINREQLLDTLNEQERFNRLMLDREGRVLELKQEVNTLLVELGRQKTYETAGDGQ